MLNTRSGESEILSGCTSENREHEMKKVSYVIAILAVTVVGSASPALASMAGPDQVGTKSSRTWSAARVLGPDVSRTRKRARQSFLPTTSAALPACISSKIRDSSHSVDSGTQNFQTGKSDVLLGELVVGAC